MKRVIYALFFCLSLFMLSCTKENVKEQIDEIAGDSTYGSVSGSYTGLINSSPIEYNLIPIVYPKYKDQNLPESVDLSSYFPSPIEQTQNNCVSVSISYYIAFIEAEKRGWNVKEHMFSPSFIYNQVEDKTKSGFTTVKKPLEIAINKGSILINDMPEDSKNLPSQIQIKQAETYKIQSYSTVEYNSMRALLAEKKPILIGIEAYDDYLNLNKDNPIFDTIKGESRGGHMVTIVGYNDKLQAFKFLDSRGKHKGLNGYGYISYNLVRDNFKEMYVINPNRASQLYVNLFATEGGVINNGSMCIEYGSKLKLVAEALPGYKFIRLDGDVNSTSNHYNLTVTKHMSIRAVFEKEEVTPFYYLDINNSTGGVVTATGTSFIYGQQVTINANPYSNNIFDYFLVNGAKIRQNPYTFVMKADTKVEGIFKKINQNPYNYYSLKVHNGTGGYTSAVNDQYSVNTTVQVESYPYNGYMLDYWLVDNNRVGGKTLSLLMDRDHEVYPVFKELYYASANETINGQKITGETQISVNDALKMNLSINGDLSTIVIKKQNGTFRTSGRLIITTGDINNIAKKRREFRVNSGDSEFVYEDSLSKFDSLDPRYSYPKKFFAIYIPDNENYIYWVGGITVSKY